MNTIAKHRRPPCSAFTLVELLVVIGIIGLLVSILLPSLWRARSLAQRSACANNIRDIVRGCLSYAQDGGWNRRDPAGNYTPDKPFISAALPSIGPTAANWGDFKDGNPGCLWLLLTGRYPTDTTTNSIKQAWTGMAVVYCPEAAGPRGLRAPMPSDAQMRAETSSYGYLSQVPIELAASGTVQHIIYTGTSIHEAKAGLVVVADSNPHCTPGQTTWNSDPSRYKVGDSYNSPNHRAEGQNAGKLDGSVRWSPTSTIDDDDIYTPGAGGSTAEGRRAIINDSLILD